MDNTVQDILKILISNGLLVGMWYLNKPKQKEETKALVVEQYDKLNDAKSKEIERLQTQIEENRRTIHEAEKANEDCEYRHEVQDLNHSLLMKTVDINNLPKATVMVLDDNKLVTMEFKNRFKKVTAIDCIVFTLAKEFIGRARVEKPEVVIMDWALDNDLTALDVAQQLGYTPEIMIMSQDKGVQLHIKEQGYQFFYKDDHYVMKIARAVIRYLQEKY